jgi:probable rRNA maturation factor
VTLSLSVQYASRSVTLPSRAQVRRWVVAAHQALNAITASSAAITVRYVDVPEARALNLQFRGKDYATNVLTFVSDAPIVPPARLNGAAETRKSGAVRAAGRRAAMHVYAADVVICAPVIAREARAQRKTVRHHHAHMVIHGLLHAQGFDHDNDDDAARMEAIEVAILKRFRIKNLYAT